MEIQQISEVQKETARVAIEGLSNTIDIWKSGKFQTEFFKNMYKLAAMSSVDKIWNGAKDSLKLATENLISNGETLIGLKINGVDWPISAYFNSSTPPENPKILTDGDLRQIYVGLGGKQEKADDLFRPTSQ